ncbi:site-specific DNA-methyltransferase [Aliarcobacter cryaerophilus]|uniref:site-specific DNA-methyltransferase n=1 Tax=Aliarcobacter cryaerophilus TaxID=28198 RepID=UPI0021B5E41C|nr:site-specific DNA-methyltransferase [Aliarcobacter cryaerophilus]MCT7535945.1 site-specific DNA-methyltransferase [Aliarcobacter cryaerophilus]
MQNLDGKSKDLVNENIEKLKEIFPEVFSEGKIDFSKLEEELGNFKEKSDERYNFTWSGKSEAKKIALTPSTGTLRPCKVESKDWDTTQNLYIEGDNLEVLKLLQKSYHKKVKMIYIDPPYNTGKDFVYKDNFRDNIKNYLEITGQVDSDGNKLSTNSETSGRYHSDWLNMMYPRLKLARNLLKDDGVIFISIDDNEVANLRKLCDEIFGEDNFVESIIWKKRATPPNDRNIGRIHEYLLCYGKNTEKINLGLLPRDEKSIERYTNPDNDIRGAWVASDLSANGKGGRLSQSTIYPIINPHNGETYYPSEGRCWLFNKDKMQEFINEGRIGFRESSGAPYLKRYLNEVRQGLTFPTILTEFGFSSTSATELDKLFITKGIFEYAKPTTVMCPLIQIGLPEKDEIILDFYSGSATTAHAVMKLNSEDDGNRKFICVQLPESTDEKSEAYKAGYKNICEIGKERIRRAGEQIIGNGTLVPSKLDIGFKVLKLDSSNIKSWDSDFENLEANLLESVENIKSDRSEEDLLYEILLKYGLPLSLPIEEKEVNGKKLYNIGFGALIICLDSNISIDITDEIIAIKKEYDSEITRVVFKDSGFKNATEKTNIIKTLNQNGIDEVVSV